MKTINWRTVAIVALLIVIGVLIARMCSTPATVQHDYSGVIDSLKQANIEQGAVFAAKYDSIDRVVCEKEQAANNLQRKLEYISEKYLILRGQEPSHDTIVQTVEVFDGRECLEKLPVIQAQLDISNSINVDLRNKIIIKDRQIVSLQSQFDKSISINGQQAKDIKRLQRKAKWNRALIYGEAILGAGIAVYFLTQ